MEKQLALFKLEENDDFSIWPSLPEETRQKIESIFAKLLLKHLSPSIKEVKEHE